jgi:cephalosporin-C deacetylase-like acetyl esterase
MTKTPLRVVVESVTDKDEYWKREKITFAAAYGNERVIAYLFSPKKSKPPFQTVLYFPGVWVINIHSSTDLDLNFDFILKSGRAVMYPIYKGTYERRDELKSGWPNASSLHRDHVIAWSKDLGRSIDYLETRTDVDRNKVGYFGISWGSILGALLPAVETRLRVCVLYSGGFSHLRTLPEVDQINFASHVKQPVLMLNGRYDFVFPVESSQNPMFRLLGAPPQDKGHLLYNTAHDVPGNALIQETLAWYDRYLGPVKTEPCSVSHAHACLANLSSRLLDSSMVERGQGSF